MSWQCPNDFINKVSREWIKVRWIKWPATVHEWSNILHLKGKKPKILIESINRVCTISSIILETPELNEHWIRKRIQLEWCWDELFNPENFRIAV